MRSNEITGLPFFVVRCALACVVASCAAFAQTPDSAKPVGRMLTGDDFRSMHQPKAEDARAKGAPRIPAHLILKNGELQTRLRRAQAQRRAIRAHDQTTSNYTYADLAQLSYPNLVALLVSAPSPQITDMFACDPGAQTFYEDSARIQYLLDALQSRGATFTADDDQGVVALMEIIRAGFYLSYFCPNLTPLNAMSYRSKVLPALHAVQANPNFWLGTITQDVVISETALLIDDATGDPTCVNNFTPILRNFNDHWRSYAPDYFKGSAAFWIMLAVDFDLSTQLQWSAYTAEAAGPYAGAIDGYLNEVARMATTFDYNDPSTNWIIDNAVYFVGYDGRFHSTQNFGLIAITAAIQKYGNTPWVFASAQGVETIHRIYNDIDSNGQLRDWEQFKQEIRAQYTPVSVDFDCGLFHTRSGSQVDPGKMKTLIWAHKETRAQFFRALRSDVPVDPSHHNDDSLTIIIYNSPDEYRMNRFAYELATNNGGIYIESMGTFFSYERTPAQSYYTLEELFRHEGVHYLQERYEEPGYFGDSPLYDNCRVTWMDEGSAEFFAGSTRTEGVKVRSIEARLVAGDDPSTWYTISDVVHACYGSFVFYHYADAFVGYLYHNHWDNYMGMLDRLMANDPNGFSAITTQDAADPSMNTGYHDFLQYLTNNAQTFPTPSTSPNYLNTPQPRSVAQISAEVQAATGLANLTATSTTGCTAWDTYTLRGTYAAGASKGSELADWQNMDAKVNAWLVGLANGSWSGYRTDTGYFTNYQTNGSGQVTWQVAFHGIMNDGSRIPSPAITAFLPLKGLAGTSVVVTGSGFSSATAVSFGGVAAQSFTVDNDTQITAVVPVEGNPGPISVTTPAGGTGFSETSFKVLAISSFYPTQNSFRNSVALNGSGFTGATQVRFNGTPAWTFLINSDSSITTWVPDATTGPIEVDTPDGTLTSTTDFVVIGTASFVPDHGYPGTVVTLSGKAFTGATGVLFGNISAPSFSVDSDTQITTIVPLGINSGATGITVTMPNTTYFPTASFVIDNLASLSFSPASLVGGQSSTGTITLNTPALAGGASIALLSSNPAVQVPNSLSIPAGSITGQFAVTTSSVTKPIVVSVSVPLDGTTAQLTLNPPQNPVPSLSLLSPSSAVAGTGVFTLTVNGANFISSSTVRWNGSDRPTTYLNSTQLQAAIASSDIAAAGSATVTVSTPAPGGGVSNGFAFSVQSPVPSLSSLSPTGAVAGTGGFTLTVNGANFTSSSVIRWNGSNRATTYVKSTQLQAAISASDIALAGSATVTVSTPAPGGGVSNGLAFSMQSPVPSLNMLSPASVVAGSNGFTLAVNGANFNSSSTVLWNGSNHPTTYVNSTQLQAAISASDIASAGSATVTVSTPAPGGGLSNSLAFSIAATPTFALTTSAASLTVQAGSSNLLSVIETVQNGFKSPVGLSASGAPAGVTVTLSPVTLTAAGSSTATVAANSSTVAGSYPITVTGTGGGLTRTVSFTLTIAPPPTFTLTANTTTASVSVTTPARITLTTTGFNGFKSAVALTTSGLPKGISATLAPPSISSPGSGTSQLTLSETSTAPGSYNLTVTATGGGLTQTQTLRLTVLGPSFTLTLSANSVSLKPGGNQGITVTAAAMNGFKSAVALSVSGLPKGVSAVFSLSSIPAPGNGSSTMTLRVTSGNSASAGSYSLTVTGTGGGMIQARTLSLTIAH